jgi:hypothetical protein
MSFNQAQYEAAISKISTGVNDLSGKIGQARPIAEAALDHWYIPGFVADAVLWLVDKAVELAKWISNKIVELLEGVAAPVLFFNYGRDWQDVRGLATGVAGSLQPNALQVDGHWKGSAADAYVKQIKPQADAANKIGAISDKTAQALFICAGAGLLFYLAIGVIVVKFIVAFVGVLVALGSVVFSWAGVALMVEEAGVNTSMIIGAVSALTAVVVAQGTQMNVLHGEAIDNSLFPNGQWPNAAAANFSDATVKDGDADWSFER